MLNGTPVMLSDGTWGARVQSVVTRGGEDITITTKSGKSWTAVVSRIDRSGDGWTWVATMDRTRYEEAMARATKISSREEFDAAVEHNRETARRERRERASYCRV
jgi:hypothetical protein